MEMYTFHSLKLPLHSIPITFYMLCVYASRRIHEVQGVVDNLVAVYIWKLLDSPVCSPFIRMDNGVWLNMRLYDWEESGCISSIHQLHVPQSRFV